MAAGYFSLERNAAETAAAFLVRVAALHVAQAIEDDSTVDQHSYTRPTYFMHPSVTPGAGNPFVYVGVDRNAGEAAGIAVGAVGTHTGFSARIAAALTAAGATSTATGLVGLPPMALYDPPTFICIFVAGVAGNALEVQVVDNILATGADANPGGWTTTAAGIFSAVGRAGGAVFVSD